jgi:hypothetical protein
VRVVVDGRKGKLVGAPLSKPGMGRIRRNGKAGVARLPRRLPGRSTVIDDGERDPTSWPGWRGGPRTPRVAPNRPTAAWCRLSRSVEVPGA